MAGRGYLLGIVALIALAGLLSRPAMAQKTAPYPRVTRGVYLQSGTSNSIVVRWRTAQPTTSVVRYGVEADKLISRASSPGRLKDHVVLLSGLNPGTRYFYSVGTSNEVFQRGPLNHFVTAPLLASPRPARVWVLGDPGTGSSVQRAVRDAYLQSPGAQNTDLVLTLGDNAYSRGTDAQYGNNFFDMYRDVFKHTVVWPALGNHDARSADSATESGVYYSIFTLPRLGQAGGVPSGTQAYYSFDYADAHFICLNSEDADVTSNSPMLTWLRRDLAANANRWTVAYWHHPPYSKGSHDSDDENGQKGEDIRMTRMRQRVLPLLESARVDLVLCGHTHLYERSFLLRGHYGKSTSLSADLILDAGDGRIEGSGPYRQESKQANRVHGTVYVNTGSAGHATKAKDLHGLNHPVMFVSLNIPGSFVLDISSGQLDAFFLDDKGRKQDHFTLRAAATGE